MTRRLTLGLAILALGASDAASAPTPPSPESFAGPLVSALKSTDTPARLGLLHPTSQKCLNEKTAPYFNWIFKRQAAYADYGGYKASAKPMGTVEARSPEGKSAYPIKPTHQLQIDFTGKANTSASMIVLTVFDQGRWWEVLPCPDEATVNKVRQVEGENIQRDKDAALLVEKMPLELRHELANLLQSGRRVDAIRRYADAAKQDITMARSVIGLLEQAPRK